MSVNHDGSAFVKIDEAYQCLEHNHALIPQMHTLQLTSNEVKEMVQNMIDSDISPVKIRKFLFNQGINDVSTLQIRQMQVKFSKDEAFSETDELIKYVKEKKKVFTKFSKRLLIINVKDLLLLPCFLKSLII